MGTGNRVAISKAPIGQALGISRSTVARAIAALYETRLLLEPDDGLPIINPVYIVHNAAERDQLVDRFGVDAVKAHKAGPALRTSSGGNPEPTALSTSTVPHLRLVR